MAKTPEGAVKDDVKAALKAEGVVPFADILSGRYDPASTVGFFYMPVAGPYAVLGVHDFIGCWSGVFFTIETKAPNNPEDATAHQQKFCEATRSSKGLSYVGVRSADVVQTIKRDVQAVLESRHAYEA